MRLLPASDLEHFKSLKKGDLAGLLTDIEASREAAALKAKKTKKTSSVKGAATPAASVGEPEPDTPAEVDASAEAEDGDASAVVDIEAATSKTDRAVTTSAADDPTEQDGSGKPETPTTVSNEAAAAESMSSGFSSS